MIKKSIFLFCAFVISLHAGFKEGEKLFADKCSSCHGPYISIKKIKHNFFEANNKDLNLKYSSINMLVYAIVGSPTHIGDEDDKEMQQIEIEEYLINYLENPTKSSTISDKVVTKYLQMKKPMKGLISSQEASEIALYFMEYKKNRKRTKPKKKKVIKLENGYNEKDLLQQAKSENKNILVYATSKTCYYCKKMEKNVLSLKDVKSSIYKDFLYLVVDIDKVKLPFKTQDIFKGITPTFFFLSNKGKILSQNPGAWTKEDFLSLLKENMK